LPAAIDLKERKSLVIGGGSVAERKVKTLLDYGADLTVVSPELNSPLRELFNTGKISYLDDIYRPAYLKDINSWLSALLMMKKLTARRLTTASSGVSWLTRSANRIAALFSSRLC